MIRIIISISPLQQQSLSSISDKFFLSVEHDLFDSIYFYRDIFILPFSFFSVACRYFMVVLLPVVKSIRPVRKDLKSYACFPSQMFFYTILPGLLWQLISTLPSIIFMSFRAICTIAHLIPLNYAHFTIICTIAAPTVGVCTHTTDILKKPAYPYTNLMEVYNHDLYLLSTRKAVSSKCYPLWNLM